MRILIGAYSLLYEDLAAAFSRLGHDVRVVGDHDPDGAINVRAGESLDLIASGWAQLAVYFNGIGLDDGGAVASALAERRVPHVFWFVDDPDEPLAPWHVDGPRFAGALANPALTTFVTDWVFAPALASRGARRRERLMLAASDAALAAGAAGPAPDEAGARDGAFVGTSSVDLSFPYYQRQVLPAFPALRPVFDEVIALQAAHPNTEIGAIWSDVLARRGVNVTEGSPADRRALLVVLRRVASSILRCRRVQRLAERGLEVWGDDGWAQFVDGARLHPRVPYGRDLQAIYRASRVNVNVSNLQLATGLNQRVFDAPAAGAFLLTDFKADLTAAFALGEESAFYADDAGLLEQYDRFRADPAARRRVAEAGRKRVLAEHTFDHRARAILREALA
ncbi:MAG: glycosyltransferase family 1 protein [Planctomycetes bacterium]|nr:glycosyltransferase family 1 protein [Planctomycetota bacterium]